MYFKVLVSDLLLYSGTAGLDAVADWSKAHISGFEDRAFLILKAMGSNPVIFYFQKSLSRAKLAFCPVVSKGQKLPSL